MDFCTGSRLADPRAAKLSIQVASICIGIPDCTEPDEELINGGVNLICDMLNDISTDTEELILTDALDAAIELLRANEACQFVLQRLDVIDLF